MMMMMMNVHHEPVNEALIRDDGDVLYPVRDDIAIDRRVRVYSVPRSWSWSWNN